MVIGSMIPGLVFIFITLLGAAIAVGIYTRQAGIEQRLGQIGQQGLAQRDAELHTRIWGHAQPHVNRVAQRVAPASYLEHIQTLLWHAGSKDTAITFVGKQIVIGAAIALVGWWLAWASPLPNWMAWFFAVSGILLPYSRLRTQVEERAKAIYRELPDLLDLLAVLLETGLPFDTAIEKISKYQRGIMIEAFVDAQNDIQMYRRTRAEAYQLMAKRLGVPIVEQLMSALISAELSGADFSLVVRRYAEEIHRQRRAEAQRAAQEIGVKIFAPLFACFLPVLFIIILYPIMVQFSAIF